MNQYVIKLSSTTYKWMESQNPVVQRVLSNLIAAHFSTSETAYITKSDILDFFFKLTNKASVVNGCQEMDRLFNYNQVGYVS